MGAQSTTELDSMTVDDLCEWLDSQGIPSNSVPSGAIATIVVICVIATM